MNIFKRRFKSEQRAFEEIGSDLSVFVPINQIGRTEALNIPTVSGCVEIISNTVAKIPIKLYREKENTVEEVTNDIRVKLLNDETGDLLNSYQMKKAMVRDFLLDGQSYIYINKQRNLFQSLHYIEDKKVNVMLNTDPIFKRALFNINGSEYQDFDFIKITRNTENGVTGSGIIKENQKLLSVAYNTLLYEENLIAKGGNKRGFLKAQRKLMDSAITELKKAWRKFYANNDENVIVLNDGIDFQEASNTSVEMQLNESKITNSDEICKIFNVPPNLLKGTANEEQINAFVDLAIMPILTAIETALNKDLLLETEKGKLYFAFDTKQLIKGDLNKKINAYKTAIEAGIMKLDEARFELDLPKLDFKYIKLGLSDVLFDPETNEIYTPNTNANVDLQNWKGGEGKDEGGN